MEVHPQPRDCSPVIPGEAIAHFMNLAGVETAVPHVLGIFGMAAQKFISDIGASALQFSARHNNLSVEDPDAKFTLNLEDLYLALDDYDEALHIPKKVDYLV